MSEGANSLPLLLEIGVEELPAGMQGRLVEQLKTDLGHALTEHHLLGAFDLQAAPRVYSTPRRLAVFFPAVLSRQSDQEVEHRGPPVSAAFDDAGNPTKAATGFAGRFGVGAEALERRATDGGEYLYYTEHQAGRAAMKVLAEVLPQVIDSLPVPKRMRWGDLEWGFARPIHCLLALFGEDVVPFEVGGISSDRFTRGHRYHAPDPVHLDAADSGAYTGLLRENFVEAHATERHRQIEAEIRNQADKAKGRIPDTPQITDLLDEVTGLVEWPVPFTGGFGEKFLELPKEVLVTSMEKHQKFFPVEDGAGSLLPAFIGVANIDSKDPEALRAGHERVLRARLEDARFFWEEDRKRPLADRVDALKHVVFQAKLGTLFDKAERLAVLAPAMAEAFDPSVASLAERAGWLAKADLLTDMVDEFDTLQGIMGGYYATGDGEDPQVAAALAEQYRPGHARDVLPETGTGTALALADRLDTMVGCFGVGLEPTGTKDPFALRRAAIGIQRMAIEKGIHLDLPDLLARAYRAYGDRLERDAGETVDAVIDFLNDRLEPMYTEAAGQPVNRDVVAGAEQVAGQQGTGAVAGPDRNQVSAVLSLRPTDPYDAHLRLRGLLALLSHPNADSLIAANKRIGNILRKAEESVPAGYDGEALSEAEERALAAAFEEVRPRFQAAVQAGDYTAALLALAELREPADRFFDAVLVMAEDDAVRRNRLALLQTIHAAFLQVADLSKLPG
ncbi:glycine--tRNA ligase subunit beta [Thiohalorhabdus methylotrophus]|uniref:Glycine--tRNA ligase beta subunit n=1 Tax=Thiohalorhabdus methylotrophus TaxID=3242694 RepID=A0ABV4TSR6_9GAMM